MVFDYCFDYCYLREQSGKDPLCVLVGPMYTSRALCATVCDHKGNMTATLLVKFANPFALLVHLQLCTRGIKKRQSYQSFKKQCDFPSFPTIHTMEFLEVQSHRHMLRASLSPIPRPSALSSKLETWLAHIFPLLSLVSTQRFRRLIPLCDGSWST